MADKKISDLTAATSLVAADLLLLELSGGNSRKITAQNLHTGYLSKANSYQAGAANTASGAWTKCPIDTNNTDTDSIWNNSSKRFIPTKAGYYIFSGRMRTSTAGALTLAVGQNGAQAVGIGADIGTCFAIGGSIVVLANGTTDYFELWYFAGSVRAITTGGFDTWMQILGPF